MWNEWERQSEERELVYEITWISELGVLASLPSLAAESDTLKNAFRFQSGEQLKRVVAGAANFRVGSLFGSTIGRNTRTLTA